MAAADVWTNGSWMPRLTRNGIAVFAENRSPETRTRKAWKPNSKVNPEPMWHGSNPMPQFYITILVVVIARMY